ncbi:TadE family type IV pilus minor pilin [Arthrobacter sp. Br18]|uniref:TadE family type IV pilus minor pilin n=1 Tax=Arthrobacter sp. Br18 TaxID=1312954 RepID=UPI0020A64EE3|nr:TadE family type IV pilus minor pilin [Arthrobacter sp. Br18]
MTAEIAVALPALVLVFGLFLGAAAAGMTQLRLEEAARAGAREVLRGEAQQSVEATVRRLAGADAAVRLHTDAGWTSIEVTAPVRGPVVGLLELTLSATASGRSEHG